MTSSLILVLERLSRRLGREAARFERLQETAASPMGRERAYGEANVLRMAQGFIRQEIRKAKEDT